MKKKKNDLFDYAMDNTMLSAGSVMGVGLVSKLPSSPISGKVISGMSNLSMLPRLHATGGIFSGLQNLEKMTKKKKRR